MNRFVEQTLCARMAETSSVVDMEGSKLVDFDMWPIRIPRKGANENDHELDAECKQNGQEMPEPKTTSRSEKPTQE